MSTSSRTIVKLARRQSHFSARLNLAADDSRSRSGDCMVGLLHFLAIGLSYKQTGSAEARLLDVWLAEVPCFLGDLAAPRSNNGVHYRSFQVCLGGILGGFVAHSALSTYVKPPADGLVPRPTGKRREASD